jgi:hypothetical protein
MTSSKVIKYYLIFYFIYPIFTLYFTLLTTIKIPMWIEIIPLILCVILPTNFRYFRSSDFLFVILILNSLLFIFININDYSWINNIEIRSIIIMSFNYFIFRSILRTSWTSQISELIVIIMKYSMYLIVIEFIIINLFGIYEVIENRYLYIYENSKRLYEFTVFGIKSLGLYPGTHNASIASTISILYLILTKSIYENKKFLFVSIIAFIISFSITAVIVLLIVYSIVKIFTDGVRNNVVWQILYFLISIGFAITIFTYNDYISQMKAFGEVTYLSDKGEKNVYINSIIEAFNSLIKFPMGTPIEQANIIENEVYISRLVIYFGLPIVIFFLYSLIIIIRNLKSQDKQGLFFSIAYLCLFISSFHYGSINYYPLNILIPFTFILFEYSKKIKFNNNNEKKLWIN